MCVRKMNRIIPLRSIAVFAPHHRRFLLHFMVAPPLLHGRSSSTSISISSFIPDFCL